MTSPRCSSHCLHLLQRFDVTNAAGGSTRVTKRCCQCGELQYETLLAQRDPEHGPYAPLVVNQ